MKSLKYLFFCALITVLAVSCKKGLDPIEPVPSGPDLLPPVVLVDYPTDGKVIRSADKIATITLKVVASDDIELKSVTLVMDGTELTSVTSFKDYRRVAMDYVYDTLTDGDHVLTVTAVDMTDKTDTKTVSFRKITVPPYIPMENEVIYFPFDGNYFNLISGTEASVVGTPSFVSGKLGDAYAGAIDSYLEYPSAGLTTPEFSVAFWYKLNPLPLRGGILSISPDTVDRTVGLRIFRENNGTTIQNFGLNFGIGTEEVWMNPFLTVKVDTATKWMHFAISLSQLKVAIYVNGEVVLEKDTLKAPIDWTGCPSMSIASGMPNFVYWEHFYDLSDYDEMHFFSRAITREEVQKLYNVK
jgi:hypothetical protein